jgi:hypothetical protein
VSAGQTVNCTYTNVKRGQARVVKTVAGGVPGPNQSFTFELRQGATATNLGTVLESQQANAGNGGQVTFTTQLLPGETYQLCEIVMPGWRTSLTGTFVPASTLPGGGPNPDVDNSLLCVNFTVTAGETKVFTVDNTPPPAGLARTIGFWKNWSSCTGGNQVPVLDRTLALFSNGVPLGSSFSVKTCAVAVAILNKSDIKTGQKMSSNPLYNMAAQLLAVELNWKAGAAKCSAVVTAEAAAQALLTKYSFKGYGDYPKLTKVDAAQANSLAATLDAYNNNQLC